MFNIFKKKPKEEKKDIINHYETRSSIQSMDYSAPPQYEPTFFNEALEMPLLVGADDTQAKISSIVIKQKLPMFNGQKTEEWIKKFKKDCKLYKWSDDYQLQILPSCMVEKSVAEIWWDKTFGTTAPTAFADFETRLLADLGDQGERHLDINNAFKRNQQLNERCFAYYWQKQRLLSKLEEKGMTFDEEGKVHMIVQGLDPIYLDESTLKCKTTKDLIEVLKAKDLAKEMEEKMEVSPLMMVGYQDYRYNGQRPSDFQNHRNFLSQNRGRRMYQPYNYPRFSRPMNQITDANRPVYQYQARYPQPINNGQQNNPQFLGSDNNQGERKGLRTCYNCNSPDHFIKQCPTRQGVQIIERSKYCENCKMNNHNTIECRATSNGRPINNQRTPEQKNFQRQQ